MTNTEEEAEKMLLYLLSILTTWDTERTEGWGGA